MRQLTSILALPFLVAVVAPGLFVWWRGAPYLTERPVPLAAGALLVVLGLAFVVWTIALFATAGRGTLAPWDPPAKLVISGPYRYVRNPMITGVASILAGEALAFFSLEIALFWAVFVFANAIYIPLSEEPGLLERFGTDYERYARNVPAFTPRRSAWDGVDRGFDRAVRKVPTVDVSVAEARVIAILYGLGVLATLILFVLVVATAVGGGPGVQWLFVAGALAWACFDLHDARVDARRPPPPLQVWGKLHEDGRTFELRESPDGSPVGGWRLVRRDEGAFVLMRPRIASRAFVKRHRPADVPFRMATHYAPKGKPNADGWIRYPASAVFDDPPGEWKKVKVR